MSRGEQVRSAFRADINGLRAWAVIAVVLYHFGVPGFGGGFVGVDVFFVISGFLMTGIIIGAFERNDFSLWSFYMARARRILPALIAMCTVLIGLGWFFLTAVDYKVLGLHVALSLTFLTNFKFWREAGYFDSSSHEKWLLHTWSLSVEWQFYVLLPLALFICWKVLSRRWFAAAILAIGAIASLALSAYLTPLKPVAAFYLLPTRAWEMLAGSLVFFGHLRVTRFLTAVPPLKLALDLAGFVLIAGSIAVFDVSTPWPGWKALVPVLGACLILLSARKDSVFTAPKLAQWLGDRSYSIYLWHWPVVVVLVYIDRLQAVHLASIGIAVSLLLGHLSFKLVEKPSQQLLTQRFMPMTHGAGLLVALPTILIAALGAAIYRENGVLGRQPANVEMASRESNNTNPRPTCLARTGTVSPSCVYGGADVSAILMGDSHADATTTAMAAAAQAHKRNQGVLEWSYVACPTIFGVQNVPGRVGSGENCRGFNDWAYKQLSSMPADIPIVLLSRTTVYALGYNEPWADTTNRPPFYFTKRYATAEPSFLREFSGNLVHSACKIAKTRDVYLVRPIPEMRVNVPQAVARRSAFGLRVSFPEITLADYHLRHRVVWEAQDAARRQCGVKILNPLPYLCRDGRCRSMVDGRPIYADDDHLSEFGSKLLVPMFREVFADRSLHSSRAIQALPAQ